MQSLCDGRGDDGDHPIRLEQHLVVVEAQHGVSEQDEPGVGGQVAAALPTLVVGEPVELHDQPLADEPVHTMAVDRHLLANADPDRPGQQHEAGLDP